MVSEPQVDAGTSKVEKNTSLPAAEAQPIPSELVNYTAGTSDPTNNICRKGKERRCASNRPINSESCNLMVLSQEEVQLLQEYMLPDRQQIGKLLAMTLK